MKPKTFGSTNFRIQTFLDPTFFGSENAGIQKIMDPKITVNATCVRVPVFNGHSEAVFIKTKNFVTREEVLKALNNFNGVTVIDNPDLQEYPTPLEHANDTEEVYVGRVRSKDMHDHGLISLWIVADNVYGKGAALNAIQIDAFFTLQRYGIFSLPA